MKKLRVQLNLCIPIRLKIQKEGSRIIKEIQAIDKLKGNGVPKILDSYDGDEKDIPYFITEWIEGYDLDEFAKKNINSIEEALLLTRKLALILDSCHQLGIIHRDIKPSNIRINQDGEPTLVDFGLSWINKYKPESRKTPLGQEIGNRFLRLPEFSAGSLEKQNKIADVTFLVGILFYLVTETFPRQLKDDRNLMPHERESSISRFINSEDPLWEKIQRIFRIGFQQNHELRFKSAISLIEYIDSALRVEKEVKKNFQIEDSISEITEIFVSENANEKRKIKSEFHKINQDLKLFIIEKFKGSGLNLKTSFVDDQYSSLYTDSMAIELTNSEIPEVSVTLNHAIMIRDKKLMASHWINSSCRDNGAIKRNTIESRVYYESYENDLDSLKEKLWEYKTSLLGYAVDEYKRLCKVYLN